MDKKTYITEEEHRKCRKVADAFAELEDVDVVVVDAGRYGFVKLQYYTPPTGFENDFTFTDSRTMFDDLWEAWLHTQLIMLAREMGIEDIDYDDIFRQLPGEKQDELMGRKQHFAEAAGIETERACRNVEGGTFSLVGSVIIFSITFPARFPEVRRWKTSV